MVPVLDKPRHNTSIGLDLDWMGILGYGIPFPGIVNAFFSAIVQESVHEDVKESRMKQRNNISKLVFEVILPVAVRVR